MIITLLVSGCLLLWLKSVWNLWTNINAAKAADLPIVISPVNPFNPFWLATEHSLSPWLRKLPFGLGRWVNYTTHGWNYFDRFNIHLEKGKAFALVSPSSIEVFIADAAASDEVFVKKKQFGKPTEMLKAIEIYGPTVATTEGPQWQRHRRIAATPFNNRNNRLVWIESLAQTQQMLEVWNEKGNAGINSMSEDFMTLALHVITAAGFGKSYHFRDETKEKQNSTGRPSYRDCLSSVLQNVVIISVVPRWIYSIPFLPKKLRDYREAATHLKDYMVDMISAAEERQSKDSATEGNLLSALVTANQKARLEDGTANGGVAQNGLTDEETLSNIFIFSFAGHETTAHTLAYAYYHLIAHPEWQDWVMEELDYVLRDQVSIDTLDFQETFPQLKRCLALMHETLRLFPPVLNIPKCNGNAPHILESGEKSIRIPPQATVYPNVVALQTHPDHWGPNTLEWQPSRWIEGTVSSQAETDTSFSPNEEIVTPVKGAYIPWGDGPRVCPGKKFSHVEFVAVVAATLWKHRLEVVPEENESEEDARQRIKRVTADSVVGFTLAMRKPESVKIRLVSR